MDLFVICEICQKQLNKRFCVIDRNKYKIYCNFKTVFWLNAHQNSVFKSHIEKRKPVTYTQLPALKDL